jgi:transposase
MPKSKIRYVGLDVHKDSISIAFADKGNSDACFIGKIPSDWASLHKKLLKIGDGFSLRICYEAGPTGYQLYRRLQQEAYDCIVIAPSKMPRKPGDRVKTDRRDAIQLALNHRSGYHTPVTVPDPETEALRDLERCRENAKKQEIAVKNQLNKFLLRYNIIYNNGSSWTQKHFIWLRQLKFELESQQIAFLDCLEAVESANARVDRLTAEIERMLPKSSLAPLATALKALRGIQTVSAAVIVAEIGDLRRFPTADQLMAYVGLCPSQNSSGARVRTGSITKTGNQRVRRILVEAAWHYRTNSIVSKVHRTRLDTVSPGVRKIALSALRRLHLKYNHLTRDRNKNSCVATVAIARELVGFIWAIGHEQHLLANQATQPPEEKDNEPQRALKKPVSVSKSDARTTLPVKSPSIKKGIKPPLEDSQAEMKSRIRKEQSGRNDRRKSKRFQTQT